ncbi:MAG TPA: helix-turn-helix domain-containing protein [Candidatus Limnocylindria bacterium]|jgi:DNA-binding transcriptional regulator YiaG|nr:helix-turn-helix domain-containing protein [Candidatus Limnocylindria bacterium]
MKTPAIHTTIFNVHIPNVEGDAIAETVPLEVQFFIDSDTGMEVLTPDSLELIERTKTRRLGLILPEELKALRERLELTQEDISELLQIGAKTYTRWEAGRARPSRSMNVMLCALRDGVLTLEYLRALRTGGITELFALRLAASQWAHSAFDWDSLSVGSILNMKPEPLGRHTDLETTQQKAIEMARARLLQWIGGRMGATHSRPRNTSNDGNQKCQMPDRLFGTRRRFDWVTKATEE